MAKSDREVAAMYNSVEEHNNYQVSDERVKAANIHQKQKIARLTEEMKLIRISVTDLQFEAKTLSSENNIAIYKVQNMQGGINSITAELITTIKK